MDGHSCLFNIGQKHCLAIQWLKEKPMSMRSALISLVLIVALITYYIVKYNVNIWGSTLDIHVHDTYYVVAHFQFMLLSIIATFFFLGGATGTKFRNRYFLYPLLLLIAFDLYWIIMFFITSGII